VSPLPFESPAYEVSLLWAATHDGDPGLRWLGGLMADVFGGKPAR